MGHVCGINDNHRPFAGGDVAEGLPLEYVLVIIFNGKIAADQKYLQRVSPS